MNKRLQQRTDESDNLWWDAFATEFFEDDAAITLTFCLEDGPKRYSKTTINFNVVSKLMIKVHRIIVHSTSFSLFRYRSNVDSSLF